MPQVLAPFGLSTAGYLGGKPRSSSYTFPIASGQTGSFGSGEPIAIAAGNIDFLVAPNDPQQYSNEIVLGVFQSVEYQPAQPGSSISTYSLWISGTTTFNASNGIVSVNVDPMQIYNVQANGTLSAAWVGRTFNLTNTGYTNTSTGQSQVSMNNVPAANFSGATNHVKLIGLAPKTSAYPTNSWSDPYPIVQVVLNNTQFKAGQCSAD